MSRLWLIGVLGFVGALAAAGLIVAVVTQRNAKLLPASKPEGTVQRYLLALEDRHYEEAYGYLSVSSRTTCTWEQFLKYTSYREVRDSRMTLADTQIFDSRAVVTADVTVFDLEQPLNPQEYSYTQTFDLLLEKGQWRLESPDYWCPPFS